MHSLRLGARGTMCRMLEFLRDIAPLALAAGSAAIFAAMLWAGSRVH
jgi:hypothetical protein